MKSHQLHSDVTCPQCHTSISGATGFGEKKPNPGDMSICMYCGAWLTFEGEPLRLRLATEDERQERRADPRYQAALTLVETLLNRRRH